MREIKTGEERIAGKEGLCAIHAYTKIEDCVN